MVKKQENSSIFLHGLWRCGSTYVWSKFRELDNTYCYYEPLHHGLKKITTERIDRDTPDKIANNAHPSMAKPYFEEFRPLIKSRGVPHYKEAFAFDRFALNENENHPKLQSYIDFLLKNTGDKNPVLGFNRTPLRIGWTKQNFGGTHIYILRNPLDNWYSYWREMQRGNYTYFTTWLQVIERNAAHPLFKPLAERLPLRNYWQKLRFKPKEFYPSAMQKLLVKDTYFIVHYLWKAAHEEAKQHADIIFDMNKVEDKGYKEELSKDIRKLCGLDITFPEAVNVRYDYESLDINVNEIEKETESLFQNVA